MAKLDVALYRDGDDGGTDRIEVRSANAIRVDYSVSKVFLWKHDQVQNALTVDELGDAMIDLLSLRTFHLCGMCQSQSCCITGNVMTTSVVHHEWTTHKRSLFGSIATSELV